MLHIPDIAILCIRITMRTLIYARLVAELTDIITDSVRGSAQLKGKTLKLTVV